MFINRIAIKEVWIHIIAWVCFLFLPVSFAIQVDNFAIGFISRFMVNALLFYISYLVLVPKLLLKKKYAQFIVISILVLIFFNVLLDKSILPQELAEIQKIGKRMDGAHAFKSMRYFIPAVITFSFLVLGGSIALVKDFVNKEKREKEREFRKTETELQFLKNQLNPHFLFNALNSIYSLVRKKSDLAPDAVISLSELMRYMLYEVNDELVALTKEVNYIENYIKLQKMRLSDSRDVILNLKGDFDRYKIYPLLLVSFIENAFKYGTDSKGRTDIAISLEVVNDTLYFRSNNFLGTYKKNEESSGIGLSNIKNRLLLLYPERHHLAIRKDAKRYFVDLEILLV